MTKVQFYQHDDAIKWKHFPHNWPFVLGIHRSPVNTPHKGRWRGALMFNLICAWTNGWANNRDAGDLRRDRGHYDVIAMKYYAWHVHDCYDKYTELLRCPLGYLLIVYNWISWLIRHICSIANCGSKTVLMTCLLSNSINDLVQRFWTGTETDFLCYLLPLYHWEILRILLKIYFQPWYLTEWLIDHAIFT